MTGEVAPSGGAAETPALPSRRDPCFTGVWHVSGHLNLEALLRAQGVPERNIPQALAASTTITQHIQHTRHHFRVTVNNYTTTYLIVSGHTTPEADDDPAAADDDDTAQFTADQLLTANTMQWQPPSPTHDPDGSNQQQRLVVTSGAAGTHSERRLGGDGRMVVVNEKDGERATSWFERRAMVEGQTSREEEERKQKMRHDRPA